MSLVGNVLSGQPFQTWEYCSLISSVDVSLPPVCICPSSPAPVPGYSYSPVWKDAPCPEPTRSALRSVDASFPPVRNSSQKHLSQSQSSEEMPNRLRHTKDQLPSLAAA